MINNNVFVAGHTGRVGSYLTKLLINKKVNLITQNHKSLDLMDYKKTLNFLKNKEITSIYMCAGKIGGIYANIKEPVKFLNQNTIIQLNIINAAFENNIKNLILFGSSCMYPKMNRASSETDILKGKLDSNDEGYGLSKISALKLIESYKKQFPKKNLNYTMLTPCNLFGSDAKYDPQNSTVVNSLIKKIINAKKIGEKTINIWGTGKPKREFLHISELCDAAYYFMNLKIKLKPSLINIGYGKAYSINTLAAKISRILDYKVNFLYDKSKPDGAKIKLLEVSLMKKLKWKPKETFDDSLKKYVKQAYN
jgi:GDP-L-fucose synthase